MTFTRATLTKLRALNLPQETADAILEIFEEAQLSKPKKKGCVADRVARGTRLPDDWILPTEWRQWAISLGMRPNEVDREARGFKSYWLNVVGAKGLKLKWDLTWQTWCRRTLERWGRPMNDPETAKPEVSTTGPEHFTDSTWRAIARRYKSSGQWNSDEWGPPPGRMDCQMPVEYL